MNNYHLLQVLSLNWFWVKPRVARIAQHRNFLFERFWCLCDSLCTYKPTARIYTLTPKHIKGASTLQRLDPQSLRRAGRTSKNFGKGFWERGAGELLRTWDTSSQNLGISSQNPIQNSPLSPEDNKMHVFGHQGKVLRTLDKSSQNFGQGFSGF